MQTVNDYPSYRPFSKLGRYSDVMSKLDGHDRVHIKTLKKGEYFNLVRHDNSDSHFYIVLTGALQIYTVNHNGVKQIVRFLDIGDSFEDQLDLYEEASVCIGAITSAKLYYFSEEPAYLEQHKDLLSQDVINDAKKIILAQTQWHISWLSQKEAQEKVAAFLIERYRIWEERQYEKGLQFPTPLKEGSIYAYVPMSYSDISNFLAISQETTSRTFSYFRQHHLIASKKHQHIRIFNVGAIVRYALGNSVHSKLKKVTKSQVKGGGDKEESSINQVL